jgi:hypothetical protein
VRSVTDVEGVRTKGEDRPWRFLGAFPVQHLDRASGWTLSRSRRAQAPRGSRVEGGARGLSPPRESAGLLGDRQVQTISWFHRVDKWKSGRLCGQSPDTLTTLANPRYATFPTGGIWFAWGTVGRSAAETGLQKKKASAVVVRRVHAQTRGIAACHNACSHGRRTASAALYAISPAE